MPGFITVATASSHSSQALGALRTVNEIDAHIVTVATNATLIGTSPVRRVRKQCWYGIGFTPAVGPYAGIALISWQKYLEMESEQGFYQTTENPIADTLYWDIQAGGVMHFEVDWN